MHIVVTGGGTGGHVFPALEIIKELRRQSDKVHVTYVGNKNSLEEKMAQAARIPFHALSTKKMVGQGVFKKLIAVFYLTMAIISSLGFLIKNRPQAVIGVGGYVSVPMLIASFLLAIRRYVCEQNAVPGMANKYLAFLAKKVFISFEKSRAFFPKNKIIHSGNPVRNEFFALPPKDASPSFKILITGGSLGARFLNLQIPKVLGALSKEFKGLSITHQTGEPMHQEVSALYNEMQLHATVTAFVENMPTAFAEHDLLISRAGATVCAEIMASGMPAILVPYPFANAHQKYNALALTRCGAAMMIEEDKNFASHLALTLKNLYSDPKILHQLTTRAKSMGAAKAAFIIANTVLNDL